MNKFDNLITIGVFVAGLFGVGYAIGTRSKVAKIGDTLNRSIDELANSTPVDISQEMIDRAVEKAVAKKTEEAVTRATALALSDIKADVHIQVRNEVEKEYDNIKETVLKEITASAAKIDVARVRADIEKAATEKALEKFDVNLNDILDRFNSNLENTQKIYSSIAQTFDPKHFQQKTFTIGV